MRAYAADAVTRAKQAGGRDGVTIRRRLFPAQSQQRTDGPVGSAARNIWNYTFRIVPYEDTKEQILLVIASLGDRIAS